MLFICKIVVLLPLKINIFMKRILLLLILSVCLLPLWPQETVTPVKPLSARIDALIEHKLPAGSNVAISVYDLTAGKPLYGYQADKLSLLFFTLVCGFVRQGFLFVRQKALKLWQYAVCQYREFAGNVPVVQYF